MIPLGRTSCPACGAPVIVCDGPGEVGTVMLDTHEASRGAGRYAIWDDGKAHRVTPTADVLAHPLHDCSLVARR